MPESNDTTRPIERDDTTPDMSFVKREAGRINFWAPERPEDYAEANAKGRAYAEELLIYSRASGNPAFMGSVIRGIVQGGVYGPVEVGFCHCLGVELIGIGVG